MLDYWFRFFFQWLAQQARVWLSTGLPNGPGGGIRFSMVRPTRLEGFRFSMVRPTGSGGFVFQWFAQRAWRGFVFQWFAQRVCGGFVFQRFAQRAWRGFVFQGSPNVSDFDMRRHANPLNSHTARAPCYMCYMCYMGLTRQPAEPPLSPPCYMCYMCYMGLTRQPAELYTTHIASQHVPNMPSIAHIVQISRVQNI